MGEQRKVGEQRRGKEKRRGTREKERGEDSEPQSSLVCRSIQLSGD